MNLDDKHSNETPSGDPAAPASSLSLKPSKAPANGAKPRRPRKASDAMGGAAAKEKAPRSRSRKKALSFDESALLSASAPDSSNVVALDDTRTAAERAAPEAPQADPVAAETGAEPCVWDEAAALPGTESEQVAAEPPMTLASEPAPTVSEPEQVAAEPPMTFASEPAPTVSEPEPVAAESPVTFEAAPAPEAPMPIAPETAPPIATESDVDRLQAIEIPTARNGAAPPPASQDQTESPRSRFEAIAARAAKGQSSRGQPGSAVQAALAAQQQAAERARQGNDFYSFWAQRRNGRRFPAYGDFDAQQIAELWPNTMLLSCGAITGGGAANFTQVMRLSNAQPGTNADEVNFTPMVTEWILAIGREAASAGRPVQDIETFQTMIGSSSYRIVALPLGSDDTRVDHVLCNLARA
jgi:hypothetical protein